MSLRLSSMAMEVAEIVSRVEKAKAQIFTFAHYVTKLCFAKFFTT